MTQILILYYSSGGSVAEMAQYISRGVESVENCEAILRTVPKISSQKKDVQIAIPENGPPYVSYNDLVKCDGLALGSPTRFGNMAAPLKYFIDGTGNEWLNGALTDKPAGLFTSTSSLHGGQESTLLTMAIPLLHHGMLIVGLPYAENLLAKTKTGGTPYGASHVTWNKSPSSLSNEEKHLAHALGKRVARIAMNLSQKCL